MAVPKPKYSQTQIEDLLKGIHDGSITDHDLPEDLYYAIADYLKKGLYEGFGNANGSEEAILTDLRDNVYLFSAAKVYQFTKECANLLVNEEGQIKPFKEFFEDGSKLYGQYNEDYAQAEYVTTIGQAQMAEQWQTIEANKELLPMLTFSTDGQPCPECEPFEGLTMPVDDPIWDTCTPLLHFRCFTPDTPVLTKHGWVRIDSIKENDLVIGGSGNEQTVTRVHINVVETEMLQIGVKNNSTTSTKNHRFLTVKGWARAENILLHDIIVQNIQVGIFNKVICAIHNLYTIGAYLFMSIKAQRKARMIDALDANIHHGQKHIWEPIIYYIIAHTKQPLVCKKIKNNLLAFCEFFTVLALSFWVIVKQLLNFIMRPFIYFWVKHRIIFLHSFRCYRVRFAQSWMGNIFQYTPQYISGFLSSFGIIYPLQIDTFRGCSNLDFKFSQQSWDKPIANVPFLGNLFNSKPLIDIKDSEGFTTGQPLDSFNSLFDFIVHSICHRKFVIVNEIKKVNYSGQIYNISIENDESYIINVGVVHNCECILIPGDDETPQSSDDFVKDLPMDNIPDDFKNNPGKTGEIFTKEHPYFHDVPEAAAKNNFGLPVPEKD